MNLSPLVRNLGLAGILGAGAALYPSESEASPKIKLPKTGFSVSEATTGPIEYLSQAANFLIGKTLSNGLKITNVAYPEKGGHAARNFRKIEFQTPEGLVHTKTLSKDAVHTLCSMIGYKDYTDKFSHLRSPQSKSDMVYNSRLQREKVGLTGSVPTLRDYLSSYIGKSKILDPGLHIDEVQIRWEGTQMNLPRKYADFALKMKTGKDPFFKDLFKDFQILHSGQRVKGKTPPEMFEKIHTGFPVQGEDKHLVIVKEKGKFFVEYLSSDEITFWNSPEGKQNMKSHKISITSDQDKIWAMLSKKENPYSKVRY